MVWGVISSQSPRLVLMVVANVAVVLLPVVLVKTWSWSWSCSFSSSFRRGWKHSRGMCLVSST